MRLRDSVRAAIALATRGKEMDALRARCDVLEATIGSKDAVIAGLTGDNCVCRSKMVEAMNELEEYRGRVDRSFCYLENGVRELNHVLKDLCDKRLY